jgi:ATP-dependent exoDNAse (exonuclease V) alpha subunit
MNTEQQSAYDEVLNKNSILLTGPAGTGKSYTLKEIVKWARLTKRECATTSTTGSSAFLIGGRTIHSFLGIGLGTKTAQELAKSVMMKNKQVYQRLKIIKMLVIDEISMLDVELFDKISEFLSIIRKNPEPFGGLQLIFCGDFCQIPPVKGTYCFKSEIWKKMNIKKIILKTLIRQEDDIEFQEILEALRYGKCTKSIIERLNKLKDTKFEDGIVPTILYGKNVDVDSINKYEFDKLISKGIEKRVYNTIYSKHPYSKAWGDSSKVHESICLCIGLQVMLTWNVNQDLGLINGSRGVIVGFDSMGPIIKFIGHKKEIIIEQVTVSNEDNEDISISFMPIKLAYAITHHKSQGCTLDSIVIDLDSFTYGQAYTALSRSRNLKSIKIVGTIRSEFFKVSKDVIDFYNN